MPTATASSRATNRAGTGAETPTAIRASLEARVRRWAAGDVPAASTVAFRWAFGLLVAGSSIRFLWRGWVDEFYLGTAHHLTYPGFDWVEPWPAPWMHLHVAGLAVLGLLIAAGVFLRWTAALFVVAFTYVELIDRSLYLNHYWFMTLAGVLLVVLPQPSNGRVPAVTVGAIRAQLACVYVFAGLAKLNPDWLIHGEPLHTWLAARTDRPVVGPLLDEPFVALVASWAGAAFDLTIVGFLVWRRSRPWAYAVLVVFHLATAMLFQIGVFPWVMIALTPIFFAPDWPWRFDGRRWSRSIDVTDAIDGPPERRAIGRGLVIFLMAFAALNVALPLRHWFADGNVRWNDDGYELSWRVMLTERSGFLEFDVVDPDTGTRWRVGPDLVLADWQISNAQTRPQLALQTAQIVAEHFRDLGHRHVRVYADSWVAMNGRLRQRMIDPDVDLAAVSRWAPAATYVLPLDPPVRD